MRIAILGAGNVGAALARVWTAKSHEIIFGVPNPAGERVQAALASLKGFARAATNAEAVAASDIVALSVPWRAAETAIRDSGDLTEKIVIDCTNPLAADLSGLEIGLTTSAAEQIAAWAPTAHVVKAFNTMGAALFGNARFGDQAADGYYCGNDAGANLTVKQLIEEAGLVPVDVGPLKNARLLEPLAMLWIDLAVNQRQGPGHAFKLLRR
jgi:hypothetical protein